MHVDQARALIERQARAWEQADVAAIVADFAPDAIFISPGGRLQGHDAVRAAAESFFAVATDIEITITRVLLDGNHGAVEWTWRETNRSDSRRRAAEDGIIFELRDDKIVYWREYFDTAGWLYQPAG
jgi:uncharacterized protein (TIGR02246 family)